MIPKNRPTPLGEFIKEDILNELDITQAQLANSLGVSYESLNQLINEKTCLTATMALRLSKFTKTSPEMWLNLQLAVDLWDARHNKEMAKIDKIQPYTILPYCIPAV